MDFRATACVYVKARLLDEVPYVDNRKVPEGSAEPGQTNAHKEDTPDDHMREMKIAFAGDQLTRVRFTGAKDLLLGSHTPPSEDKPPQPNYWILFKVRIYFSVLKRMKILLYLVSIWSSKSIITYSRIFNFLGFCQAFCRAAKK